MRVFTGFAVISLIVVVLAGCKIDSPFSSAGTSGQVTIQSLTATPMEVGPGGTSLLTATVTGGSGALQYEWKATGNYGYLTPMDTLCIFSSPPCHSGPATVTVTVYGGSQGPVTDSVNLN